MFQKLAQLLAVASFAYAVQCIKISFGNDRYAAYTLDEITKKDAQKLVGGMAFVRFATVDFVQGDFKFKPAAKVALKIAKQGCSKALKQEDETYKEMKKRSGGRKIDGILETEDGVGSSSDLITDLNLHVPLNDVGSNIFSVIVMERWGKDLLYYQIENNFTKNDLLEISRKINVILEELEKIGVAHGDVKPQNILLNPKNDPKGSICLSDFGLAVLDDSNTGKVSGDIIYVSPAMMLTKRAATHLDDKFSGAISIIYLSSYYLPWRVLSDEFTEAVRQKNRVSRQNAYEQIAVLKAEFNCESSDYPDIFLPKVKNPSNLELKNELIKTIQMAAENDPPKIEIQEKLRLMKREVAVLKLLRN